MTRHEVRFPNESEDYRSARDELLEKEIALRAMVEEVGRLRRTLPRGGLVTEDYEFTELDQHGQPCTTRLSELFEAGKDSLIVYSYMFSEAMELPCPSCTSIIDAFNGSAEHVGQRTNLVIVAKSPIERIWEVARTRGWNKLRLLSSTGTTYNVDYQAEAADGGQLPVCNVFQRTNTGVHHFWSSEILFSKPDGYPRHMDQMWPLWNLLDLTPEGRGEDWYPKLSY